MTDASKNARETAFFSLCLCDVELFRNNDIIIINALVKRAHYFLSVYCENGD